MNFNPKREGGQAKKLVASLPASFGPSYHWGLCSTRWFARSQRCALMVENDSIRQSLIHKMCSPSWSFTGHDSSSRFQGASFCETNGDTVSVRQPWSRSQAPTWKPWKILYKNTAETDGNSNARPQLFKPFRSKHCHGMSSSSTSNSFVAGFVFQASDQALSGKRWSAGVGTTPFPARPIASKLSQFLSYHEK